MCLTFTNIYLSHFDGKSLVPCSHKTDFLVLNEGFTLRSFQKSWSGLMFRRPSLLSVQPCSHKGRDGTGEPGSSFSLASNKI